MSEIRGLTVVEAATFTYQFNNHTVLIEREGEPAVQLGLDDLLLALQVAARADHRNAARVAEEHRIEIEPLFCEWVDQAWGPHDGCREFMREPEEIECRERATHTVCLERDPFDFLDEPMRVRVCDQHVRNMLAMYEGATATRCGAQ